MAGILEHLPELQTILTPSVTSFDRIQPQCWAGAYQCWGIDNREAALRVRIAEQGECCFLFC